MSITIRRTLAPIITAGALAAALLPTGSGLAHVVPTNGEGPAGGFFQTSFRIGHGCEVSPTVSVRIQIPEGVTSVRGEMKPGWEFESVIETLDEPIQGAHGEITERVAEVIWTGGPLPDANYAEFGLTMALPDTPGETLYFPVIQTCEEGELAWIEIPAEGEAEPEHPAPAVLVVDASGDGHGASDGETDEAPSEDGISTAEASAGAEAPNDSAAGDADDEDDDTMPMVISIAALVVGAVGLVVGGSALLASRRKG